MGRYVLCCLRSRARACVHCCCLLVQLVTVPLTYLRRWWRHTARAEIEAPATTTTATKDELLDYYRQMFLIRRVEITSDVEYKVRWRGVPIHRLRRSHCGSCPGALHPWFLPLVRRPRSGCCWYRGWAYPRGQHHHHLPLPRYLPRPRRLGGGAHGGDVRLQQRWQQGQGRFHAPVRLPRVWRGVEMCSSAHSHTCLRGCSLFVAGTSTTPTFGVAPASSERRCQSVRA